MKPDICIYHGNCADGFGAAWAVWKRWAGVEFVPGVYGKGPPAVDDAHVPMVDFSYKRSMLEQMALRAASITILDHHKTAAEDLNPFTGQPMELGFQAFTDLMRRHHCPGAIRARFDMNKSGAVLAWEFCHPGELVPTLLHYVQDRDLWRFSLENSREVAANLFSYPYDFEIWDALANAVDKHRDGFVAAGVAIERKHHKDIDELLGQTLRYMVIGGQRVPVANLPYTMASDAAGKLAEGNSFAACYFDRADARVFSLRSRQPDGSDVSEIASRYGGGGHKHEAGFQMPIGWEGDQS